MEQSPVKLTLCFLVFAVGTEAMNYLAFPRMGRSPRSVNDKSNGRYNGQAFAFPRGRRALGGDEMGYLAFPRMGRSNNGNLDATDIHTDCCPKGIKTQWVVMGDSKPDVQSRCLPDAVCCDGLEELVGRSSEHVFFTKCVPKESDEKSSVLDRLLRKS